MRFPTSLVEKKVRQIVRHNSVDKTVTRPDDTKGAMGESVSGTTSHTESMWLFSPSENPIDTEFGERLTGNLQGLALPSADIEHEDRINYNSVTYEVADIVEWPESNPTRETVVTLFSLTKQTNPVQ